MFSSFLFLFFRNPMLNKSFDVLPQVKDDNIPSVDLILEENVSNRINKSTNGLNQLIIKIDEKQ